MLKNQHEFLQSFKLGKITTYNDRYDASLLHPVPRATNRKKLGLLASSLPFHGADIWTFYELSWLNKNGLPQVAIGEVMLDASSINLIESKSLKLYLNSFNQTIFASLKIVQETLLHDLSHYAQGNVQVCVRQLNELNHSQVMDCEGECIDNQPITIKDYHLNSNLLVGAIGSEIVSEILISNLLKSNCLITHQPDWGTIQIRYLGPRINREALLRYIVSFRQHNEFHEHCVERIFTDLIKFCHPENLSVYARYNRRGGLDINPWRSNTCFLPLTGKLIRQ